MIDECLTVRVPRAAAPCPTMSWPGPPAGTGGSCRHSTETEAVSCSDFPSRAGPTLQTALRLALWQRRPQLLRPELEEASLVIPHLGDEDLVESGFHVP